LKNRGKTMAFKPGKSGNPQGRLKGALNQTTRAGQELLDGEARNLPGGASNLRSKAISLP
jgi:hypothetical protein